MIGRTYLERGKPVVVLARWRLDSEGRPAPADSLIIHVPWKRSGPRNVLIRRADGELVVRPFRGLRKVPDVGSGS